MPLLLHRAGWRPWLGLGLARLLEEDGVGVLLGLDDVAGRHLARHGVLALVDEVRPVAGDARFGACEAELWACSPPGSAGLDSGWIR